MYPSLRGQLQNHKNSRTYHHGCGHNHCRLMAFRCQKPLTSLLGQDIIIVLKMCYDWFPSVKLRARINMQSMLSCDALLCVTWCVCQLIHGAINARIFDVKISISCFQHHCHWIASIFARISVARRSKWLTSKSIDVGLALLERSHSSESVDSSGWLNQLL